MNLILYVMDSLRPDFLSCYGHKKETSPNIYQLSRNGILFKNAFSVSTWTRPAAASILTGIYPDHLGLETMDDYFSAKVMLLPEIFRQNGCVTIGISAMPNVSSHFGFSKGFDKFVDLYKEISPNVSTREGKNLKIPTSKHINDFAFPFLEKNKNKKFFMFIWSIDTHAPYFIRGSTDRFDTPRDQTVVFTSHMGKMTSPDEVDFLKKLYEKMIYYNDFHIGKLIDTLECLGIKDQTAFIITSDHGEAFMEHGFNGHGGPPFDEQIRIPLILSLPGSNSFSRCAMTQLTDLFPSVISLFNLRKKPSSLSGTDFSHLLIDDQPFNNFVYFTGLPDSLGRRSRSIRTTNWKLITYEHPNISPKTLKNAPKTLRKLFKKHETPKNLLRNVPSMFRKLITKITVKGEMLFDLQNDPSESNNLAKSKPDVCSSLRSFLAQVKASSKKISPETFSSYKDKNTNDIKKHLKALGYYA